MEVARYIDHTLLKAVARQEDIRKLCDEAKAHSFFSVCVNGANVAFAASQVAGSGVKVAAVVGFPLGAMAKEVKVFEAAQAVKDGASEIDMVINIGALKSGDYDLVEQEIREIKRAIGDNVLKVIIETCYLSDGEKAKACGLAVNAGADFVKTSTGFGTGGATPDDVGLMKKAVGGQAQVKASGGIKNLADAQKYIEAGATRLGTSSGVEIVQGLQAEEGKY
ncbi:deoxyribose-phosphate aldolase [Neisseria animaloris]|uniref:deoxyribose-phosphate aldolase n=1 Tax=Neisseria animaloris TaxID=326522 RepID=UPI000D319DC1|nr:deoxyribose-phosphate aldolase [Neisseria animaloris]